MNNKICNSLLATTAILSIFVSMNTAFADEGNNASTDVTAKIVTDDDQGPNPPIVNPTDPDDSTGSKGLLTLDYASSLQFGEIKLNTHSINKSPENTVLDENNQKVTPKFGAQVTDIRGTGTGWNLKVSLSPFKGIAIGEHTLKGAQLVLPKGEAVTNESADEEAKPTAKEVTLNADSQENDLFTATVSQGMGSWFDEMKAEQIKLRAPSVQYADSYQASINWTLQDTPA
mgnify:CR=1 FL=1